MRKIKRYEEFWIKCEKCKGHKVMPRSSGGYYEGTICHYCGGRGVYWVFGDKRNTSLKPQLI
jgi:rRNA maturation endonuclease Nob1